MKYIYYSIISLCYLMFITSCKENEMETYKNDPAIYFNHEEADSIAYSFFTLDSHIPRDTVWVEALTMGLPSSNDREFLLTQTNSDDPDAAIPGVHYVPFDDPEVKDSICIKAGEVTRLIPVILLRDESLKSTNKRLIITFKPNEYFRLGIDAWRSYTITMTDTAIKPSLWDSYWRYYLGASWGVEKMRFAIEATGYKEFEERPIDPGLAGWMGTVCKQKLKEYNEANPDAPLSETDGTRVSFDY